MTGIENLMQIARSAHSYNPDQPYDRDITSSKSHTATYHASHVHMSGSAKGADTSGKPRSCVRYFHTDQVGMLLELTGSDSDVQWRSHHLTWGKSLSLRSAAEAALRAGEMRTLINPCVFKGSTRPRFEGRPAERRLGWFHWSW